MCIFKLAVECSKGKKDVPTAAAKLAAIKIPGENVQVLEMVETDTNVSILYERPQSISALDASWLARNHFGMSSRFMTSGAVIAA